MQLYGLISIILAISGIPNTAATSRLYDDSARVDLGRLPDGTVTLHVVGHGKGRYYTTYPQSKYHQIKQKSNSLWKDLKQGFKKHVTRPIKRLVGLEKKEDKLKRVSKMLAEAQKLSFGRRFCNKLNDINKVLRDVDPMATGVTYPDCKSKYHMRSSVAIYPVNARATAFGVSYGSSQGSKGSHYRQQYKHKSIRTGTKTSIKYKSKNGDAYAQLSKDQKMLTRKPESEPMGQKVQRMVQNMFGKMMSKFEKNQHQFAPCQPNAPSYNGTVSYKVKTKGQGSYPQTYPKVTYKSKTPTTCDGPAMVSQPTYQSKGRYTIACPTSQQNNRHVRKDYKAKGCVCAGGQMKHKVKATYRRSSKCYSNAQKSSYKVDSKPKRCDRNQMKHSYKMKTNRVPYQAAAKSCKIKVKPKRCVCNQKKHSYKMKVNQAPYQKAPTSYKIKAKPKRCICNQMKHSYKTKANRIPYQAAPTSYKTKVKHQKPAKSSYLTPRPKVQCQRVTSSHPMLGELMGSLRQRGGPKYCSPQHVRRATQCHWAKIKHGYQGSMSQDRHGKPRRGRATVRWFKDSNSGSGYCVRIVHHREPIGGPVIV